MLSGDLASIVALVWIVGCIATFFYLLASNRLLPGVVATIFAASLFLRLVPALILPVGAGYYEMSVFRQAADIFRSGESIYQVQVAHPYLPLEIYWFVLADWLAESVGLFFVFWVKFLNVLADSLIAVLIYWGIAKFRSEKNAQKAAWLYVFNPITIMVAAYQGQFDAVPLFFIVLAWYFYEQSQHNDGNYSGAAWFTGLAILSKTWPFILAPILFLRLTTWRQRLQVIVLVALPVLMGILLFELLFPGSWEPMLRRATRAGAISGWWGYSAVINVWRFLTGSGEELFQWVAQYGKYLGYLSGFIMIWLTRKRPLIVSLLLTMLVMQTAVPNLGLQSLCWIVPAAIIANRYNALGWFVAGALVHMLISYWGIHITDWLYRFFAAPVGNAIVQLSSLSVWSVMVLWWIQELIGSSIKILPDIFSKKPLVSSETSV